MFWGPKFPDDCLADGRQHDHLFEGVARAHERLYGLARGLVFA